MWLAAACGGGADEGPRFDAAAQMDSVIAASAQGSLVLTSAGLGDAGLKAILADTRLPALRSVTLTDNRLTGDGVAALIAAPQAAGVKWLNVSQNPVGDAGLEALAAWQGLAGVERLFAAGGGAGPAGARALAASPHAAGLIYLSVGDQPLGDGAPSLLGLTAVGRLELPRASIGGASARALIEGAPGKALSLEGNPIGPGGLVGLTKIADGLEYLSLEATGLDLADLDALAAIPAPASLKELSLRGVPFGDAGVAKVGQIPWLEGLEKLQLEGSGCGAEARKQMRSDWGVRAGLKIEPR